LTVIACCTAVAAGDRDARDVPSSRLDPPVSGLPSSRGMIASIKSSRKEELLDLRASGAGAPPLVDDRGRRHESSSRDYDAGVPERVAAAEPLPPPPAVVSEATVSTQLQDDMLGSGFLTCLC
jgi:hypothetical protein